jgi:CBS domain containing-hemolysin-like protein
MKAAATTLTLAFPALVWALAAYTALNKLSWGRIRRVEAKNKAMAEKMEKWLDAKETHNTALAFIAAAFLVALMAAILDLTRQLATAVSHPESIAVATAATLIILLVAEAISNAAAMLWDAQILKLAIPLALIIEKSLLLPTIATSKFLAGKLEKLRPENSHGEITTTEDEILSLVEQDEGEGEDGASLEEDEKRMIKGVFELDNTKVREIMTPRVDLNAIPAATSPDDAIRSFVETGHSRIPVYDGNVDNIKGILYAKDLLDKEKTLTKKLAELARTPIFIPETKEVGDLLEEFKKNRNHFAVVIDEYGGTAGIVTLEDIIEEIVGEIRDEHDLQEDDAPTHRIISDNTAVFDARTPIDEVNEILDLDIPDNDDVDTIGGLVCGEIGRIPKVGEKLSIANGKLQVEILQADKRRVLELKITRLDGEQGGKHPARR